jgi:hypothetical protein
MQGTEAILSSKEDLFDNIISRPLDVLVMMGAGNIDAMVGSIEQQLRVYKK